MHSIVTSDTPTFVSCSRPSSRWRSSEATRINFTYPRFDLDLALFRVYEDGKPIHSENYFRWSHDGSKAGDLVFVPGNPGGTQRLNTVAHLEYVRDSEYPMTLDYIERVIDVLKAYGARGDEEKRQAHESLFGYQNALKVYRGRLEGLRDPTLMARKIRVESALRRRVSASKRSREAYGDAWDQIEKATIILRTFNDRRRLLEGGYGFNTELFSFARELVRHAAEDAKPNSQRLREYSDAARASLDRELFADVPFYPELEEAKLADSLAFLSTRLGAGDPTVRSILDGKSPEERAKALVEGTTLSSAEVRKRLADGGQPAIDASEDPMIQLAKAVDAESRDLRRRYDDEFLAPQRSAYAKIAQAIFALRGNAAYPDATFTLRLSYGAVRGYRESGKYVAPFTTIGGLFARSDAAKNAEPYSLPERWLDARTRQIQRHR